MPLKLLCHPLTHFQAILTIFIEIIFFSDNGESITFPSEDPTEDVSVPNVDFIPYNNVPMSVAHYKGKVIITVPRRAPGIPSTLNYIDANLPIGSSPSLRPYPNFETNELHVRQCYGIA